MELLFQTRPVSTEHALLTMILAVFLSVLKLDKDTSPSSAYRRSPCVVIIFLNNNRTVEIML